MVFDFDKTIINCDSDNWVVDELGLTPLFTQLLPTMPWNSLMVCFSLFHFQIFFFHFLFFSFPEGFACIVVVHRIGCLWSFIHKGKQWRTLERF